MKGLARWLSSSQKLSNHNKEMKTTTVTHPEGQFPNDTSSSFLCWYAEHYHKAHNSNNDDDEARQYAGHLLNQEHLASADRDTAQWIRTLAELTYRPNFTSLVPTFIKSQAWLCAPATSALREGDRRITGAGSRFSEGLTRRSKNRMVKHTPSSSSLHAHTIHTHIYTWEYLASSKRKISNITCNIQFLRIIITDCLFKPMAKINSNKYL